MIVRRSPLTEKQQAVLDYMRAFYERNDQLPPLACIARHFGWKSVNAAQTFADILASKGFIEKNEVGRYRFTQQEKEQTAQRPAREVLGLPVRDALSTFPWRRTQCF